MRNILNQILIENLSRLIVKYPANLEGFNTFRIGHFSLEDKFPDFLSEARAKALKWGMTVKIQIWNIRRSLPW